jgi:hypothetical protein
LSDKQMMKLVLLAAVAGGAWWWWQHRTAAATPAPRVKALPYPATAPAIDWSYADTFPAAPTRY